MPLNIVLVDSLLHRLQANPNDANESHLTGDLDLAELLNFDDAEEMLSDESFDPLLIRIVKALERNFLVHTFNLSHCPYTISDAGCHALARFLLFRNRSITKVKIENTRFDGDGGFRTLLTSLFFNRIVTDLTLSSSDDLDMDDDVNIDATALFWSDFEALATLLRVNTTLQRLDLSPNAINDDIVFELLAPALQANSTLTELDVTGNDDITERGLNALRSAMGDRGTVIKDEHSEPPARNVVHVIPVDE